MRDDKSGVVKPKGWTLGLAGVLFSLLLLASFGLALCGAASYNDSYSHEAEKTWGIAGLAVAGMLLLTCVAAIAYLAIQKPVVWSIAIGLLLLTLLGIVGLIVAGMGMLSAAQHRGGDWAGFAVIGSFVFGILFPALLGLLALGGGTCLLAIRRQLAQVPS